MHFVDERNAFAIDSVLCMCDVRYEKSRIGTVSSDSDITATSSASRKTPINYSKLLTHNIQLNEM